VRFDLHPNTMWVIEWIERMAMQHGGTVYEVDGPSWDWGQALCREQYGPSWSKDGVPADPTDADVARAKRWEDGEWPEWAEKPVVEA